MAVVALPFAALAGLNTYELKVDGLACPFCAYGIEKKLRAIEGVQKVEVEIKQGRVVVTMAEGAILTEAQARDAVKDAGFSLRAFSQAQGDDQ